MASILSQGEIPMANDEGKNQETRGPIRTQSENLLEEISRRFQEEVDQANQLLEWAVSVGKKVDPALIGKIKKGQELLLATELNVSARSEFEQAYNQLTELVSPVSWRTLRATSSRFGRKSWVAPFRALTGKKLSEALIWSRVLWGWTLILLVLILIGENLQEYLDIYDPMDSESLESGRSLLLNQVTFWFGKVVAFLYGALGACAYLMRSCHRFIHERSFDPKHLPEYYNRMFLGFLSGGTIFLFINPETVAGHVTASGLAFLAGYSTDFLFTTIERVTAAVLPKKVQETKQ